MSRVHYPTPNNPCVTTQLDTPTTLRQPANTQTNMGYQSYGGHSDRETPGPIPNPEVKPASADGTAPERWWESRTPPNILLRKGHQQWWPFRHFCVPRCPFSVHSGCSRTPFPQAGAAQSALCRRRTPPWDAEVMDVKTDKKVDKVSEGTELASVAVNEVRLVGRLSRDPEMRVLPSGDQMWTFRVVVPRRAGRPDQAERGRARLRRLGRARAGVGGVVVGRRRGGGRGAAAQAVLLERRGPASRVEVEVTSGRLVKRAVTRREETG